VSDVQTRGYTPNRDRECCFTTRGNDCSRPHLTELRITKDVPQLIDVWAESITNCRRHRCVCVCKYCYPRDECNLVRFTPHPLPVGVRLVSTSKNPAGSCRNRDSPVKYLRVRVATCPHLPTHFCICSLLVLTETSDTAIEMSPSDELEYLKSLVGQLNEKIKSLEEKAKSAVKQKTPAQQLRTILVGPPGSGVSQFSLSCNPFSKRRVISI
jgi:hypothetical protein